MNFDKLCHFSNRERGRFVPGFDIVRNIVLCPHCEEQMYLDNWPPNYWGGSSSIFEEPGKYISKDSGRNKYVCVNCCREVHIFMWREGKDGVTTHGEEIIYNEPLVERNGKLLTKHDVWREDYREEHGEYPREAYG